MTHRAWQDTAIYLFIALAVKAETKANGVVTTNPHVNISKHPPSISDTVLARKIMRFRAFHHLVLLICAATFHASILYCLDYHIFLMICCLDKSWRLTSCSSPRSLHSSLWHHVLAILHNDVVFCLSGRFIMPVSLRMLALIFESYSDHACSLLTAPCSGLHMLVFTSETLQSISSSAMC